MNVHIHPAHRQFTNGLKVVSLEGGTVGECLDQLINQYPGMEKALFAKKGQTTQEHQEFPPYLKTIRICDIEGEHY